MQNIFQVKLIQHNLLPGVGHNGADEGGEEPGVVGVLRIVVVHVEVVLQLECQGVVVGADDLEDLLFRGS